MTGTHLRWASGYLMLETLLRIWDCFLLEGPKVLFRFSLAILQLHSREIIMKCDTISVMRHLKACAKITYDVDGLVMVAFKTLKPFSRRQDIVSKQTCYLNALKEKYKWRDIQRVTYAERENVFDTRVLSMIYGNDDMVLMGTLSWFVFAYSQPTRELLWQQRLHDAVLSMQLYQDEEGDQMFRLFAGLADGTIAVFEAVNSKCTSYDLFYLPVGQSPVTCLQLLSNKLWCACGNNVSIINASTLDPKDRFTVSTNPYDTILSLVPGLPGVWISVRGSSVLELWDSENITCKMLYDTRTGKFPNLRKEDETYFNAARITSILSMDYSVWVGTGEGILITFDVFTQGQKTPSESSSYVAETFLSGDLELQSWRSESQKGDVENTARLVEVQKRVNEIFLQRQNADTDSSIFQNVEVIDVDSSSSYLELELDGMDCNLKTQKVTDFTNLALNSRENLIDKNSDDQFNQMGFLPNCKGNSKLDFISKMDLSKKFSADSTETDISVKTNTSGISSNYSHHNDLSGHVSIDSVSLHDSGYVQPISPSRHKDQVVNIPSSESQPFEEATSCGDAHFASQHIHTSTFDSPGHSLKQNDTGSLQEFHEKRSSRKSADSGISSLHEKCCQSQEQHKKSDSFVDQQSSEFGNEAEQNTEVKNNLLNSSENVAVDLISPYNSDVVSEVNNIDNPHNDTNIQFDLPNGRSVSLDSNKTTDSDEVFTDLCVPNVSDISLTADRDLCDQDNLTQEHIKEKYLQSDSSSLDKQGEDSPLENQFNSNFNRPVNDVNKRDKNTKSQHLFSAYTETQGEQIKPNSFLRRVQSLKKNFKVDQNLNSKKVSQKSSNVLVSVNQPDLSHSDLVKEPEAVIELSDVQDINHNFTSSSSISKGLTVSTNLSDSSLNSASDLSNGTCTDETSKMEENSLDSTVDTLKLGSQQIQRPNEASTTLYSDCNDAFPEALSSTISMFPCSQDSALKNVESQNAENVVKGIDTKFYGDSDEDSRVHEARVQSFKDSYKRMSSANLKFKLLHDVIPENANGPVIKTLLTSRLSDGRENPSSASSETNSRSSDIASSYFPNSNSLKKPLAAIGRQNSDASIVLGNVQSKDPYAQWRLDYTNIHVDTDIDSSVISSASNDGQGGEGDSCPPSRRLSCISGGSDLKDQRLKQFLRDTASSFSSQMGNSSEDDKRMTFLLTPNMSGCNSASWSSYDEISTTSQDNDSVKYRMPRPSAFHMESRATSIASTIDLYAGGTDLTLLSKNKISDKPVKWLLSTHSEGRPVILSFSGSHSDDEAVLLWSREVKETLWTNAPIFIYNPTTKRATLPSYMRPQLAGSARTSPRIKITSHNEA
ncbi:hypothetical protein Btru_051637 [Bulinus truncatus]|nr:hypothetical protein Btru_051637 [Bulinus truncatus]